MHAHGRSDVPQTQAAGWPRWEACPRDMTTQLSLVLSRMTHSPSCLLQSMPKGESQHDQRCLHSTLKLKVTAGCMQPRRSPLCGRSPWPMVKTPLRKLIGLRLHMQLLSHATSAAALLKHTLRAVRDGNDDEKCLGDTDRMALATRRAQLVG